MHVRVVAELCMVKYRRLACSRSSVPLKGIVLYVSGAFVGDVEETRQVYCSALWLQTDITLMLFVRIICVHQA